MVYIFCSIFLKNLEHLRKIHTLFGKSMKSKLSRRRGFTIAEIILAVAIMATLVAVMMKGLQSSRANIRRDTYQAEVNKRVINLGAKAEAYVFKNGTIASFSADSADLEDPVGGTYKLAKGSSGGEYQITLTPATGGVLSNLGVGPETYTFR